MKPAAQRLEVGHAYAAVTALLVAYLLSQLAEFYGVMLGQQINGDVEDYVRGARQMRWFYDSGYCGPFHALWVKIALATVDGHERALRLVTVPQTLLCAVALAWWGRAALGLAGGILLTATYCLVPIIPFYGVGGLRDPIFTALLVGTVACMRASPGRTGTGVLAGVLGACLYLTHTSGLHIGVQLVLIHVLMERAWQLEHRRRVLVPLAAGAAVALLLGLPDALLRDSTYWNTNVIYWRNVERQGFGGTLQVDPSITLGSWLWGEHTIVQLVKIVLGNPVLFITRHLPVFLGPLSPLAWFFPVGVVAAWKWKRWEFPLFYVAALSPMIPVMHLNQAPGFVGVENRMVYAAYPFAAAVCVLGVLWLLSGLVRVAGRPRWAEQIEPPAPASRAPAPSLAQDAAPAENGTA